MRTGLFGVVSTRPVTLHGRAGQLDTPGFHVALDMHEPKHAVQQAALHVEGSKVFGAHGVWLNADHANWDAPDRREGLGRRVSSGRAFAEVEGPLQGVHADADTQTVQLHVDFARQHPLFWVDTEWGFLFAYSLAELVGLMRGQNVPVLPDQEAASLLLTYGSILGDRTLVRGAKKLMPGHTLTWTPKGIQNQERVVCAEIERDVTDLSKATSLLDEAFQESVAHMVAVNRRAGCLQHNLLSGGLDSRLVALASARHLMPSDMSTLCFSARGSKDESISAAVARAHGWTHRAHDLGKGGYMMHVESAMEYDGCVNYLASAHHRHALAHEQLPRLGLLGSGQGANVLLTDNHRWRASGREVLRRMTLNSTTQALCEDVANQAWLETPDVQCFKMVNRGFLYTNSGAYSTAGFGVLWSPFASGTFTRAALRLHPSMVQDQRAYLTWLQKCFPAATEHVWERYNARPVLGRRLRLAQSQALWRARFRRVLSFSDPASMSPVDVWLDSSKEIQHFYNDTFQRLAPLLQLYPDLGALAERDFPTMNAMNKASVLTCLLATEALWET